MASIHNVAIYLAHMPISIHTLAYMTGDILPVMIHQISTYPVLLHKKYNAALK